MTFILALELGRKCPDKKSGTAQIAFYDIIFTKFNFLF